MTQSAEPMARVGRDRRLGLLHREKSGTCAARWLAKYLGDMEKCGRAFMAITYWRLNHNGEIMETNYGKKNFTHYGVESTYLERFKDRNV